MKFPALFFCPFFLVAAVRAAPHHTSESPSAAPPLTLAGATQSALAHNRSIAEARARWESLKRRVPQAAAWDDPRLSTSTRLARFTKVTPNSFTDHALSLEQTIPISGKNQSRARIAAAEAAAGFEELRRKQLDVILKVRTAFIRAASTAALIELNRANAASLSQSFEISRAKFEVGAETQTSVLTAQADELRITEARRDLERTFSDAETQLKMLMNRDAFTPLGKPAGELPAGASLSADGLRSLISGHRPELRMAEANVAAARAKLELAKREWIPDPTVNVQAQRYNDTAQAVNEISGGVSFSLPWVNSKKYRAGEREAAAELDAAQHAAEGAQTEALALLRDQLTKIETFHHHAELFRERLLPNARQALETSRAGYGSDKSSFLELVMAQRTLRETEAEQRMHLADYQIALAELEAIVGADLHIFPPAWESEKRRAK